MCIRDRLCGGRKEKVLGGLQNVSQTKSDRNESKYVLVTRWTRKGRSGGVCGEGRE